MFDKIPDSQIMASALASLTANYTDSEGEEDLSREEQEEAGDRLHPSLAERLGKLGDSPGSSGSAGSLVRQTNSQSGEADHVTWILTPKVGHKLDLSSEEGGEYYHQL